jgi:F420-dependent oxidoreductase-like protein
MRLGLVIDYSEDAASLRQAPEAERAGVELFQVAEAYSFDAVSRLGYLAAITRTAALGSAILPVYSRTATMLAMTAASLDELSGGRFELGLGASGPQVIEGFHGVPHTAPLTRVRETIEVARQVWRREPVQLDGQQIQIPLRGGTGLGKPLKLINHPVRDRIPVAIAALTQRAVAQAAEIAEGWIPLFFWPERAEQAWGDALADGRSRRDPALGELDVQVSVPLLIADDVEAARIAYRERLALYVGGMGARHKNFYADLMSRYGLDVAEVQDRFLAGDRAGAVAALPDELVTATALIGDEAFVRSRVQAFAAAGATTLTVQPLAAPGARLDQLEALRALM